ncbi:MAG TPA: DUF4625 domain-containing protein [Bacteroidia bacterium]|nr:DUF4625 domain-containing protein [Bacteroidia bacterium]
MIIKITQLYAVAIVLMIAFGCKKEKNSGEPSPVPSDVIIPNVDLKVFPVGFQVVSGNSFTIEGEVSDNEQLEKYTISIDNKDKKSILPDAPFFNWDTTVIATGKTDSFNYTINVPINTASGRYTITIDAIDKTGNKITFSEKTIPVKNAQDSIAPEFLPKLTPNSDANNVITINSANNDRLMYSVTHKDNQTGVKIFEIKLTSLANDSVYFEEVSGLNGNQYDFTGGHINFSNLPKGDYNFTATLFDNKNNKYTETYTINWQ